MKLVANIINIHNDGILGKQWMGLFRNAGLEQRESVFELSNSIAHASDPTVQVFGGGDDETFEMRSGKAVSWHCHNYEEGWSHRVPCPVARLPGHRSERGQGTFSIVDTERENGREHGPFGHKEAQPLRFVGGQMKAHEELLGGTYLTRLTRDLFVAFNFKSSGHTKRMREGEQRGVGGHAPATFCTRDLAPVSLHLDFPRVHAILTDGCSGIAGESATVLVVFGGIEGHGAGGWRGTLVRRKSN